MEGRLKISAIWFAALLQQGNEIPRCRVVKLGLPSDARIVGASYDRLNHEIHLTVSADDLPSLGPDGFLAPPNMEREYIPGRPEGAVL